MFSEDYEQYRKNLKEEYESEFGPDGSDGYIVHQQGEQAVHSDGVRRDTQQGKTLYTLLFPKGVPMDEQLFVRVARHYTKGGAKHGNRNWENSCAEDTLEHHTEALWRHFMEFFFDTGKNNEDHAAAVVWNVNAVDLTRRNILRAEAEAAWPDVPEAEVQSPELTKTMAAFNDRFDGTAQLVPWKDGDRLTEVSSGTRTESDRVSWLYSAAGDVWYYADVAPGTPDRSARSLRNLCRQFGPLKVTAGGYEGLILDRDGSVSYGAE